MPQTSSSVDDQIAEALKTDKLDHYDSALNPLNRRRWNNFGQLPVTGGVVARLLGNNSGPHHISALSGENQATVSELVAYLLDPEGWNGKDTVVALGSKYDSPIKAGPDVAALYVARNGKRHLGMQWACNLGRRTDLVLFRIA